MALQVSKELPSGVVGDYWRVLSINILLEDAKAEVTVGLYKDASARQSGKVAILTDTKKVGGITIAVLQGAKDPVELVYTKLKALVEFAGANDV